MSVSSLATALRRTTGPLVQKWLPTALRQSTGAQVQKWLPKALCRTNPLVQNCFHNGDLHITDVQNKQASIVLLFTWAGATEKHALKFVNSWNKRGYDVLEIKSTLRDTFFSNSASWLTTQQIVDFLGKLDQQYLVHGLSGGVLLAHGVSMAALQNSNIRITHQIFDSTPSPQGHKGLLKVYENGAKAIVGPKYEAIVSRIWPLFSKYWGGADGILEAVRLMYKTPYKAPVLYIHSMADKVTPYGDLKHLLQTQKQVAPVEQILIDETENIPHMKLYKCLGEDHYMWLISEFLSKYPNEESWDDNQEHTMVPSTVPESH